MPARYRYRYRYRNRMAGSEQITGATLRIVPQVPPFALFVFVVSRIMNALRANNAKSGTSHVEVGCA